MKLKEAVTEYLTVRQSLKIRSVTDANVLRWFCRWFGEINLGEVEPARVREFLTGRGPCTRFRHRWYRALKGFYHFAIHRGYVDASPLPTVVPREQSTFLPYIYSIEELKRLLGCHVYLGLSPKQAAGFSLPHPPASSLRDGPSHP